MAMSNKVSLGLGIVLSVAVWGLPSAEAATGARATPVPFPKSLPSLPEDADLQATLADRQAFMAVVDQYTQGVLTATENYRRYVERVQQMLAGCEVESDLAGFEGTGFEDLVADGNRQCREWVAAFNQHAQGYAAQLDAAVAFQKTVVAVGERVQGQIDRMQIALHAKQLKQAVDQGFGALKDTRDTMKPWMNPANDQH